MTPPDPRPPGHPASSASPTPAGAEHAARAPGPGAASDAAATAAAASTPDAAATATAADAAAAAAAAAAGDLSAALEPLYHLRFPPAEREAKARLWRTLCRAFFDDLVPASATVLDLGAGYCDFLNAIRAARRIGIDLNPDTPRFAAPGVEIHSVPLASVAQVVAPASIDFAFASNVLEHLPSPAALLELLAAVRSVLRPGGRLVVLQPNVRLLGGAFWDFVDHTLPLSERGMSEALRTTGFEILECRAGFLPYTTKSRLPSSDLLVRAYLACPPARWLLGKQMLIVARRP